MISARVLSAMGRPADPALLAYFRVVFGAAMLWHVARWFVADKIGAAWVEPEFHFTYTGFSWVRPLPGDGLYWLCGVLLAAAAAVTIGWHHRIASAFLAVGFTYTFLLERVSYLNHGYLMVLLAWINAALPTHAWASVDAWRRPHFGRTSVPVWTVWLLRFQVAIVYFYGGIAKLNSDWLRGEPMRGWLQQRGDWPVVGGFFRGELAPWIFSYGGLAFDLLIVPALLWRRTRLAAFLVAVAFHLINSRLFSIGVFPWMGIALTALFFDPSWPRQVVARVLSWRMARRPDAGVVWSRTDAPLPPARWVLGVIALYATVQLLVPLRHFLYPGNVSWTEEGHMFSWHMMLRSKKLQHAGFYVINPRTGEAWLLDPLKWLSPRQFSEMSGDPELVRQFCAHAGATLRERGHPESEIRAVLYLRLNGHPPALLVDPKVNLAGVRHSLEPAPWIVPLETQLAARRADEATALAQLPSPANDTSPISR